MARDTGSVAGGEGVADGPIVRLVGDAALLVDAEDSSAARSLASRLAGDRRFRSADVVCGIRSVLVDFVGQVDPRPVALDELLPVLAAHARRTTAASRPELESRHDGEEPARVVVIPAVFDGDDLHEVAASLGVSTDHIVEALLTADLTVAAVGFSPGFPYLIGLPDLLMSVPRRAVPRTAVPPGSLAIANGMAAVYPQATPGGWQLIGWTPLPLFDPGASPFALLQPGDRVRLRRLAVNEAGSASIGAQLATAAGTNASGRPDTDGTRAVIKTAAGHPGMVVEEPGSLSLVQDAGRRHVAHLGVPRAGPADPVSHRLANALVGNPRGAAALEVTLRGPRLRFTAATYVAVVGGGIEISLDGLPVDEGRVVPVAAGQQLVLGLTRTGARGYLAVAGGLVVPEVLSSRSTDTLSWLGIGPLRVGDHIGIGGTRGLLADHLDPKWLVGEEWAAEGPAGERPAPEGPAGEWKGTAAGGRPADATVTRELRVVVGPDLDWFPPGLEARLRSSHLVVAHSSDRVGTRLVPAGASPPLERAGGEIASRGMVVGAVQVLPSGDAVVLGPDHPTLGGYPLAAVVISADRHVLGQCRPGDEVRLIPVEVAEARRAAATLEARLAKGTVGHYPVESG
jgi:KipI family sensor histidine kinase inhibitor